MGVDTIEDFGLNLRVWKAEKKSRELLRCGAEERLPAKGGIQKNFVGC